MLSERLGPAFAPGSLVPFGRWSEPRISTVLPVSRLPPPDSACLAESGSLGAVWALTKKITTESSSQPSAAYAIQRSTRPRIARRGVVLRPYGSSGVGLPPRLRRRALSGLLSDS